ncbi:MAG: EAL domain-containing protein [Gammaproteobacteria bacterium]|nr:EAL domain-containing protein [Gammaproteobacteria bacterium]
MVAAPEILTQHLLLKKQVKYLYRSLTLVVASVFVAVTLILYFFWSLAEIREQLIHWYISCLFILSLRIVLFNFYLHSSANSDPQLWLYLFVFGACLNGIVLSLLIFLVPLDQTLHFTYVLLLIGTLSVASVSSLGIIKQAFFTYLASLSLPLIGFFFLHFGEVQSVHLVTYVIIFLFSSFAALRFNKSLTHAFTLQIKNQILTKRLNKETNERLIAEEDLHDTALELQLLNDNLEYKVKEKTTELENLAFYDTLTQLPNRRHFYDYLERTLTRHKITKQPFALFFIDLDEFKSINDTLGHDFGDVLLTRVASRLRECTRVDDFIARISGDEFIVIVKGDLCESKIAEIANNIIKKVSEPYSFTDTQTFISCSLGIALFPQDGETTNTLVKYSDLAMYHAKENGKNSYHFYNNTLYEKKAKKFILATALKTAIDKNELYLVYQPQVSCQDEQVSSMEVLIRWHSHQFGPVPVSKFIPLAEESHQILELENFVLRVALTQVKFWNEQSKQAFRVAINISAVHFQKKCFVQDIESLLSEIDFKPEYLELELTESALMTNTQESIDKLIHLKSLGIKLSIDDFGTGYSSMSYLKQLPIDTLKIDKSFIDGIPDDQNNTAITKAIIELAHQFNLQTIAEGVEYKYQLDFLKTTSCDSIQGYYFYKPMKADDFEKQFVMTSDSP